MCDSKITLNPKAKTQRGVEVLQVLLDTQPNQFMVGTRTDKELWAHCISKCNFFIICFSVFFFYQIQNSYTP